MNKIFVALYCLIMGIVGWGVSNASGFAGFIFGIISLVVFFGAPALYSIFVEMPERDRLDKINLKYELKKANEEKNKLNTLVEDLKKNNKSK